MQHKAYVEWGRRARRRIQTIDPPRVLLSWSRAQLLSISTTPDTNTKNIPSLLIRVKRGLIQQRIHHCVVQKGVGAVLGEDSEVYLHYRARKRGYITLRLLCFQQKDQRHVIDYHVHCHDRQNGKEATEEGHPVPTLHTRFSLLQKRMLLCLYIRKV